MSLAFQSRPPGAWREMATVSLVTKSVVLDYVALLCSLYKGAAVDS